MSAFDTNILVRYLTQDDPAQAKAVNHYIENHCSRIKPAFINHIVLCELEWVL